MSPSVDHGDTCPETIDAAAFLLGALDDPEFFREHLHGCSACRAEVEALQPVVGALATAVPRATAPPRVKRRVLKSVEAEAAVLHAAGPSADRVSPTRVTRRLRLIVITASLAACVIFVASVRLATGGATQRIAYAAVAPGLADARAVLRLTGYRGDLSVSKMPQPALGQVYEVWVTRTRGAPQPTNALFTVTDRGSASVTVPASLRGAREVMVTSEPQGGSERPTGRALLRFVLAER